MAASAEPDARTSARPAIAGGRQHHRFHHRRAEPRNLPGEQTGWLVDGSNNSTLFTNNHCFSTQTEVNTLQAKFNIQKTTCGGNMNAPDEDFAGGTFLKTHPVNGGLDYTLCTLQGDPEATWGEYIATKKRVSVGQLIYFPQHPGGVRLMTTSSTSLRP